MVVYYLSNGDPGRIKEIRCTNIKDVYKYYLLNREKDINSLLEHAAYLKYLKKMEE
ncbi:MAG: hypothetical protein P4L45_00480 [Ignavibacteriaceae bacterium]|nr:hypothetical protein [Ignavibacteriaceae bacterium]